MLDLLLTHLATFANIPALILGGVCGWFLYPRFNAKETCFSCTCDKDEYEPTRYVKIFKNGKITELNCPYKTNKGNCELGGVCEKSAAAING